MAETQSRPSNDQATTHPNAPCGSGASYRRNVIISTSIANALEWFDFVAYGFFAVVMAKLFFPSSDEYTGLLAIFATFAVPYAIRPIGALVLGAYADKHGRKKTLFITFSLMTIGTAIMAFVPTYATIGIWAAAIVIVARSLQAFSVGGEYGSAVAFLIEQESGKRGFLASWHYSSQSMTAVLATGIATALNASLTLEQIEAWGWRIPFIFGLLIAPAGFYVRLKLRETTPFNEAHRSRAPVLEVVTQYRPQIALAVGIIAVSAVTIYLVLFMPTFAIRQLGLPPSVAFLGSLLAGTIQVFLIPVFGFLSDLYSRTAMALFAALVTLAIAYPVFYLLTAIPSVPSLLIVQGVLGILNAISLGCLGALVAQLFPVALRTSGLSLSNALAQMTIGGTTPFVSLWLIQTTGHSTAPALYLMFGAAVSAFALILIEHQQRSRRTSI